MRVDDRVGAVLEDVRRQPGGLLADHLARRAGRQRDDVLVAVADLEDCLRLVLHAAVGERAVRRGQLDHVRLGRADRTGQTGLGQVPVAAREGEAHLAGQAATVSTPTRSSARMTGMLSE